MSYRVRIGKKADKKVRKLPANSIERIHDAILKLANDPRPRGCKKLTDSKFEMWRIRIGEFRVVYSVDDADRVVLVEDIDKRDKIYRNQD